MQGKRVMSLDMGLLLAGAKERGELESRVTNLIEETRSAGWCLPSIFKKSDTKFILCSPDIRFLEIALEVSTFLGMPGLFK
jgi:hypothetical protein